MNEPYPMKQKYHTAFTVFDPQGTPMPFLTAAQRNRCHFEFDAWHGTLTWKRARRAGWKVRKICYHTV